METEPPVIEPTESLPAGEPGAEEHPIGERPAEEYPIGERPTGRVHPWWRETFAETMRTAGHDPDALDARTMAVVDRAHAAGHAPELVAEALVQRQAGAA